MRADSILRASRWDPAVVFASFAANLLSLVVPMSMIHLYDRIIPNLGYETLAALCFVVVGAVLTEVVLRSTRRFLLERAGEAFEFRSYRAALACIVNADPARSEKLSRGRQISSLGAIERLRSIHTGDVALAILDLPFACLFLAAVTLISPLAGGIVAGILALSFLILRIARSQTLRVQKQKREIEERRYSFLTETLSGIEVIKSMHVEDAMQRRYERLMGQTAKVSAETVRISHFAQGFTAIVGAFSPVVIGCVGAFLVIEAQITVGALAALILLTGRIIQPALRVEAFLAGLSVTDVERTALEDVLSMPMLASGQTPLRRIDTLAMKDVIADAKDDASFAFVGVDLELKRGDCVAIT